MDKQRAFTNVKNSLKFILHFLMSILLLMGEMHESFKFAHGIQCGECARQMSMLRNKECCNQNVKRLSICMFQKMLGV
jgi:hypothetical protein